MDPQGEIVVAGGAPSDRARMVAALADVEITAVAASLDELSAPPLLLILVGSDVAEAVARVRDSLHLATVPILAVVPAMPASGANEALAAGASDIVKSPFVPAVLAARVRNLSRPPGGITPALLQIHDLLSQSGEEIDDVDVLVAVLRMAAELLGFDRASLIAHLEGSDYAFVIAATDDATRSQFSLLIADYPEIAECIRTGAPVLLDDAPQDLLTARVAHKLVARGVRGLAVFPLQWRGRPLGVMLFRKGSTGVQSADDPQVDLVRVIGGLVAAHLRHGPVLESLREQTHRISRVRYEAERRLRGIDSLKEHFEAGADGVVILDEGGLVLFVNRAAERITGFARDGLLGTPLVDLVDPRQRTLVPEVIGKVLSGVNVSPFDLDLTTTAGIPATVSVSSSTVLAHTGAVILSFRDVTAQRDLEIELRSTKEFLERLIDSTVDAIIAADLKGNIVLFNQGAERLLGWAAEEVVGRKNVAELYPDGVARQLMRMLRSTSHGGVGRLEPTRREVWSRAGELIPVNMTASIIYEGGHEVATVGIFSDLRDRIRMEQRLLQAQQKLEVSEKQALVAELAGAAAHELNQPLTSIMGFTQLVQRQSAADAPHLRALGVILAEAERMANIVKKIGRITKYETTDYVGSSKMIDLDRATRPDTEAGVGDDTSTKTQSSAIPQHMDYTDDDGRTHVFGDGVPDLPAAVEPITSPVDKTAAGRPRKGDG